MIIPASVEGVEGVDGAETFERESLVSVIIIFLNEERFLRDAISSVLAQDVPHWELLLVDDGSTDSSRDIAESHALEDSRIRYLAHPERGTRGMSASRNLGLAHARGRYVAFLDADDTYLPARIRRHAEILDRHPDIAMVVSDHVRWFTDGPDAEDVPETLYARPFFVAGDQVWKPPLGLMVVIGVSYLSLGICNVTVRRQIALQVGGFEDSFRSMYEDQVFTSKILAQHSVYVLQAYLARYRHHAASWTRRLKAAGEFHGRIAHADTTRFVEWLIAHLEQHRIDDALLLQMVRNRLVRAAGQPGAFDRFRMRITALAKRLAERVVPGRWHKRLLILDYERDRRRARRAYHQLTRILGQRALAEAVRRDDS